MNFDDWVVLSKQFSLVVFFITFVAILVWAFWPANRQRFDKIGHSLQEEDKDPPAGEK